MKIGHVEVGREYGALDNPSARNYGTDPRQVKVLEIVTVETPTRNRYTSERGTKKRKYVKVEVLNGPLKRTESWRHGQIDRSAVGDTLVIEARQLVGPWAALAEGILKRIAEREAKIAREDALIKRLTALGFEDLDWGSVEVSAKSGGGLSVKFHDEHLERALALMEAGS